MIIIACLFLSSRCNHVLGTILKLRQQIMGGGGHEMLTNADKGGGGGIEMLTSAKNAEYYPTSSKK